MVETLVISGYTLTIIYANVYEVTKTLNMVATEKKKTPKMLGKKGQEKHTGALHSKSANFSRRVANVTSNG